MTLDQLLILYDISVLGLGRFSETARTGIFRATENLLHQVLQDHAGYKVQFIASRNNYFQCREYLNAHPHIFNPPSGQFPKFQFYLDKKANQFARSRPLRLFFKGCQYLFKPFSDHFINRIAQDVDVFHSTYFPIPQVIKKKKDIVKFLTVYDLIPFLYPQFFPDEKVRQVKQALYSLSPGDFAICISQSTKNDFCNIIKFDPSRVFVVPLAASESFFPCKEPEHIEEVKNKHGIPGGAYILSVGTLEPRKNVKQVIIAFQRLVEQEKINDLNLVLGGAKSPFYNQLFTEINIPGNLKKRIFFTGYLPDQELTPLYSGALVFVYPSLYEGFGLPPLEAMQCGVPVIASNTSSLPEVVGDAGIMTAPNDSDALCHHILKIYRSSTLRHELANKSLEQAKKFSWTKCSTQTIAAYKKALNMNSGSLFSLCS
jgi:glycosyltransferase involved in cell wall biosynthesis